MVVAIQSSYARSRLALEGYPMEAVRPLKIDDAVDATLSAITTEGCGPEIAEVLRLAANELLREADPGSPGLSAQERAFLIESGEFTPKELAETEASVARGDLRELENRTLLETIAASFSESEAAEKLGVSRHRVRELCGAEQLFGFKVGAVTVYPRWQFTNTRPEGVLPHLAHLLSELLPDERDPASLQAFMTVPKEDLTFRGEQQTPIQWLLRGGSLDAINDIVDGERWY